MHVRGLKRAAGPAVLVLLLLSGCADSVSPFDEDEAFGEGSAAVVWNEALLEAVRTSALGPPMVARALAMTHTSMYDAWAAYDAVAVGTRLGGDLRRPEAERTEVNKREAVSYAAYRTLVDLFPAQAARFDAVMAELGYPPDAALVPGSPAHVGTTAADANIAFCHEDGANQLGGYADPGSGYEPVNTWDHVTDPAHWQPLRHPNAAGDLVVQRFLGAHWAAVTPFSLASAGEFRPGPPAPFGSDEYRAQVEEVVAMSAHLTDRQKVIAEYWADGPASELPPGHWLLFAQWVARRDHQGLDADVKLFFLVANAVFDAGIAAWDAKVHYDYVRPVTAVRYLLAGEEVRAWGGPLKGPRTIRGEEWLPYQPVTFPTPPFAEYVSGHSAFSAAAAEVLRRFTGNDRFGLTVTLPAGWSRVEPGLVPAEPLTLTWMTFTEAADEAGISRRYGGIHFRMGDLEGRALGRRVGERVWAKAQALFSGTVAAHPV